MMAKIVEYFELVDINDATYKLKKILNHFQQENPHKNKPSSLIDIGHCVKLIYSQLKNDQKYKRITADCHHFAYLLAYIGDFFQHRCIIVKCNPNYLGNTNDEHNVVLDVTENRYLDGSVYNWHFNGKKWVNEGYPLMTNVPRSELNYI